MLHFSLIVVSLLALASACQASPLSLGAASGFNVFVFSNFSEYNTDAEGKMAVGGNFAPANGGSFTIAGTHHETTGFDLVVGENFSMAYNSMGGGNAYIGGNMTWNTPTLPHNAYVVGTFTNNGWGSAGGTVYWNAGYSSTGTLSNAKFDPASVPPPIDFASAKTNLESLSTTLANDRATGSVTHSYSTYTLTGSDPNLNIFYLADSTYQGATISINVPTSSTVVVNVAGSSVSFTNGTINLNGVPKSNVIFNFNSASTISLSGIGFYGSILAPSADFTGNWGNLDGELIAKSASGTTQFNDYSFSGNLGSGTNFSAVAPTPEPSTWLLIAGGMLLMGILRYKSAGEDSRARLEDHRRPGRSIRVS